MLRPGSAAAAALAATLLAAPGAAQEDVALTLSQAVAHALERHPTVAAARAGEGAMDARLGHARAARLPSLSLGLTATQHQEPMVVAPLHGFDPLMPPDFDETLYQGQLALDWDVYDGGARSARVRRAEAAVAAASVGSEGVEVALIARVAATYLRVLGARETLDAHQARLEAVEAERERAELLFRAGKAPQVAVLRARAAESAARADLSQAAEEEGAAERELVRVAMLPPEAALGPLARVRAEEAVGVERAAERVEGSPAVRRARLEAAAARAAVEEARAVFLPRVLLDARWLGFGAPSVGPTAEWNAGVRVAYPLFTGGARRETVALARAEAAAAEARARAAELEVADEVDRAVSAMTAAAARVEALRDAVRQMEEVARIERLSLDAGAGTQTDYLAAEAELLRLRAGLSEARHAVAGASVRLAAAEGVLSPEWLARNLEAQ